MARLPEMLPDSYGCEKRLEDPRQAKKVTYYGKKYIDVTDFFTMSYCNGDFEEELASVAYKEAMEGGYGGSRN